MMFDVCVGKIHIDTLSWQNIWRQNEKNLDNRWSDLDRGTAQRGELLGWDNVSNQPGQPDPRQLYKFPRPAKRGAITE
jgi:hypothetical protein